MMNIQTKPSKAARLRAILQSPEIGFLMESHNGASAKISERAGFDGIWASGLSMSTALGVRDNNELSWTQVLDQLEFMADGTEIPILVDGDTGFGNFNAVRRFVSKLSSRGIAGVCLEDKTFPKTNSFLGDKHPLVSIDEFCGKIRAGKDSQLDDDFCIVARIEALIAGRPMEEALQRADAYAEAGADAVVIHSRRADAGEIFEFLERWQAPVPVVLIPTKYYRTPTADLAAAGASAIVWANHNLRASLQAMEDVTRTIMETQSLVPIEKTIYPLADVFALTGTEELEVAEQLYEPRSDGWRGVILAATRGTALGALTEDRPKCMVSLRGHTILDRQVAALRGAGIDQIAVVAGYKAETVKADNAEVVVNPDFETTGEARSLAAAIEHLNGPTILSYGDIVYEPFFAGLLVAQDAEVTILVDPGAEAADMADPSDRVLCDPPHDGGLSAHSNVSLVEIGASVDPAAAGAGHWVGLMALNIAGARKVRQILEAFEAEGTLPKADMPDVLQRLMAEGTPVSVLNISGNWRNINSLLDLAEARNEV